MGRRGYLVGMVGVANRLRILVLPADFDWRADQHVVDEPASKDTQCTLLRETWGMGRGHRAWACCVCVWAYFVCVRGCVRACSFERGGGHSGEKPVTIVLEP